MPLKPRGLVFVCGPTGSGKSTTLASMVDRINTRMRGHIVTVEDPIEFQHQHKSCLVNQREIGRDSQSFKRALKYILRQDPDFSELLVARRAAISGLVVEKSIKQRSSRTPQDIASRA